MEYAVITYRGDNVDSVLGPYETQYMAVTVRDNHIKIYNRNAIVKPLLRRNPYE
jgi:hypothetical protein